MTSLRSHGLRFARGGMLLSAVIWAGCGITIPGNLKIGDDDPSVIGTAGRGGGIAGRSSAAGRGGDVAGTGAAGGRPGGRAGAGGYPATGGRGGSPGRGTAGVAGTGLAGSGGWGGVAGGGAVGWDRDGDGADSRVDCNDLDPGISPTAEDYCCDAIDSDCDGGDSPRGAACRCAPDSSLKDMDGDGFSPRDGDCNDRDASFFPGNRRERCCDGLDNNCDGQDDAPNIACDCATDLDGDGYFANPAGGDCDDLNPSVFPGTTEICDDGIDNNCNGIYDWNDSCTVDDADRDGFPASLDCNDFNPFVHPGAAEVCNNRQDDNCDGWIDNDPNTSCSVDNDADGYPGNLDCDDRDASVWPGAYEDCFDGRDGNCDGLPDSEDVNCRRGNDFDRDGYPTGSDCDDNASNVYPGAFEACGDKLDNNCDGLVDPYPYCNDQMIDWDGDGYPWASDCNDGSSLVFPGSPYEQCCDVVDSNCDGQDAPVGVMCTCDVVDNDGDGFAVGFTDPGKADCNDQDPSINPGAQEHCFDMRDNNCNGRADQSDEQCFID